MEYFSKILLPLLIATCPFTITFSQSKDLKSPEESIEQVREYLTEGIELVSQEKFEEALSFIRKAIEIQKDNAELYRLEGQILEMLERMDEAIIAWEKCLQIAQTDSLQREAELHLKSLKE